MTVGIRGHGKFLNMPLNLPANTQRDTRPEPGFWSGQPDSAPARSWIGAHGPAADDRGPVHVPDRRLAGRSGRRRRRGSGVRLALERLSPAARLIDSSLPFPTAAKRL